MMRYFLMNGTHFIEFPHSPDGLEQARKFRVDHPEFKGKKIREGFQLYPFQVEPGKLYQRTPYRWPIYKSQEVE